MGFAPIVGCAVQRVAVDANPASHDENERAVQLYDHDSNNDNVDDTIWRPLNKLALKFRKLRATCPAPLLPTFNSVDPD